MSVRSNIINVVTTGVSSALGNAGDLYIYPNPANDHISIETSVFITDATISIYNIEGQLLTLQAMQEEKTDMDISSFAKGVYIIKVKTDHVIAINKFVKE